MSTKFLDLTGFSYFWTKLKAWIASAASNLVHRTGSEAIDGLKSFANPGVILHNDLLPLSPSVAVSDNTLNSLFFCGTGFNVANGINNVGTSRLGEFSVVRYTNGNSVMRICLRSKDVDNGNVDVFDYLGISYAYNSDSTQRIFYGFAPSTPEDRSGGTDIVTRDWIPKDSRIVHTTGAETIAGTKTLTYPPMLSSNYGKVSKKSNIIEKGKLPTQDVVSNVLYEPFSIGLLDKNDHTVAYDQLAIRSDNGNILRRFVVNAWTPYEEGVASSFTQIGVGFRSGGTADGWVTAAGTPYATAPSTPDTGDGTDIVTRNWIPKDTRIVHTTGAETISGNKTFKNIMYFGDASNSGFVCASSAAAEKMSMLLCGGTYLHNGASLQCFGKSNSGCPGWFYLRAATASSNSKDLLGKPTGTLTWNGQTIQTSSDERLKTPLSAVPDEVLDAWGEVEWGEFRFLDAVAEKGDSARLHAGLIAQAVDRKFAALGLDACRYGILCHEFSPAVPEERDGDGNATIPAAAGSELWMVRYAEALAMEAAYQRRENARLKARVSDLEDRLAALELRLGSE